MNLIAGRRAKAETAYASALSYLAAGSALAAEAGWTRRRALIFELELHRAECEFLTGATAEAEARLAELSQRAADALEGAAVVGLRIDLYKILDRSDSAIAVGLEYLRRHLCVDWSPSPTDGDVQREYGLIWSRLGSRTIEELIDLPLMADLASAATLDILMSLAVVVWHTNANLACMAISRAVNLSLERGNCDSSCYHYVSLGYIAGPRFGDYAAGYRFGRLGYELVEKRGLKRFQARTYKDFGAFVIPWTKHVRTGRDILRSALEVASQSGDLTFAAYSYVSLNSNLLAAGDPLIEVERQVEIGLAFARKLQFHFVMDLVSAHRALVRTLRGQTRKFGSFDDGEFDELEVERQFSDNPDLVLRENCHWVRKLQARFFAGDYDAAVYASTKARRLPWASVAHFEETLEHHFYGALSRAACCGSGTSDQRLQHQEALAAHYRQLQIYADNCPENFENRAALVGAEIARLECREIDAERLYEQAIRSARANGFVHHEALAYELAANFYAARGFEDFSDVYLRKARDGYLRWGADGKVRQLEQLHPYLRREEQASASTSTIGAPIEALDLATVIKMSQAVSGEIVLEKLIDTLMRTAIEQAGAERGLLILPRGGEQRIEAEATTNADSVTVHLRNQAVATAMLPELVLHYVLRTRESVILDDTAARSAFAEDPYIRERRPRSVLCVPLLNQAKLTGVLYLENKLAPRVFAPARIAVLKLLAAQAAISLENTRLYRDLAEREARIRRLVDANIIGIFIWSFEGQILEANDAFLRIVGYDREDLAAGRIRWVNLTPAEWRDRDAQAIAEAARTGTIQPYEKEYFRKDGSRVPILLGAATFDEGENRGVVFVLDLTERKAAEEALRASEERLRTLMQFSFEVYWETDAQHRFVQQEFAERLGDALLPGSGIGKTRWEVPYLEPDEEDWRNHRDTLDAHLPFRDFELARPVPDGGKRFFSVSGLPVFDRAGRFIGYRGVARDITERKQAEEALRASEERFRTLMQFSFEVYWETDAQHRFVRQEFSERLSDAPPHGSEIGKARWEVPYLEPDEETWRKHRETLDAHLPFRDFELARPMPDGGKRYVSASGLPMFDKAGRFIGHRGVALHITERKRIEEALRQREKELREVVDTIPAMTVMALPDGSTVFASRRWTEYSGLSVEDSLGLAWKAAVHPDDLERHIRRRREALASGEPFESEVRLRRASDGEYRWFLVRWVPLRDKGGDVLRWYGIMADIEDRKRAEEALRESEEQWKAVFENNPTMYFMVDPLGTMLSVNPFGAQQLGYTADELIGRPVEILFHEGDRDYARGRTAFCLEHFGQTSSWELRKIRKDGAVLWVRETARAMLIKNRPVVLIACEDISAGKRAAEVLRETQTQLAHANRVATMGQLTASIAHEVNQPIAATVTNAHAALRWMNCPAPNLDEVEQALDRIVRDGNRAGAVVRRIRDLIKGAPPRDDQVDVNAAIREVIELTRNEATKNSVLVQTELAEGLPLVQGDRVELQQVILNLMVNAVEAMSEMSEGSRELLITTGRTDSGAALVAVSDSGPGLAPADLEQPFNAFYTTKPNGLGLGLSICRSIIEAHGGRLWASANAPRGAVFQFTLPAHRDVASRS